jgi:hypothetical protein
MVSNDAPTYITTSQLGVRMRGIVKDLGAMRVLLLAVVALCMPLALWADAEPVGLGVLSAYIAPAVAVLLVFVLLLDALMSRVFAIDKSAEELPLARLHIRADLLGVLAIGLSWGPFYYSLLAI